MGTEGAGRRWIVTGWPAGLLRVWLRALTRARVPAAAVALALFLPAAAVALALLLPAAGHAQSPPFSQTLRWGTGYLDVPVAAVLPSLAFRAGYSAFRVPSGPAPEVDGEGRVAGIGRREATVHGDATLSMGLWNRVELGTSLQAFNDEEDGGNLVGFFGRVLLLDPTRSGFGLAAGARYLGAPSYPGLNAATPRLGFPDARLLARYPGNPGTPEAPSNPLPGVDADWSLYAVSSLFLPGVEAAWLPENTVSLTLGWGTGLFREGGELPWYSEGSWGGWFGAAGMEFALGESSTVSLAAEWAGLDANLGADVAWNGLRAGIHLLGLNHGENASAWRSRKVGLSISLTACPLLRRACRPAVRRAHQPDTVRLPAPPPDTVWRSGTPGSASIDAGFRDGASGWTRDRRLPAAAVGSVNGLLQHPVHGVQDGDGRAPGEFTFVGARLGPQEPVLLSLESGPDRGDDDPGVEGPDGLHAPEFSLHHLADDAVDGVQRGFGPHAEVALPGVDPGGPALDFPPSPLHGDRDGALPVGGRVEFQSDEFQPAAGVVGVS